MRNCGDDNIVEELMGGTESEVQWLLILARAAVAGDYEFIYYFSDDYDRLSTLAENFSIVSPYGNDSVRPNDLPEDMVWVAPSSLSEDEEQEERDEGGQRQPDPFRPQYVAKALFKTRSTNDEALLFEASTGWKLALQQKYLLIQSMIQKKKEERNGQRINTAAGAAAAAAIGGGTAAGGTTLAAAGMGYTAAGITANSIAAGIMASEAVASGGGVAAGGFTATMQSIGAVGVMANPVGMSLVAAGAILGGAAYFFHQRRKMQVKEAEEMKRLGDEEIEYEKLKAVEDEPNEAAGKWIIISIQGLGRENDTYDFKYQAFTIRMDAERAFSEHSRTTIAKGLFDPTGNLIRSEAPVGASEDGWEMALMLKYEYAVAQELLSKLTTENGKSFTETAPILNPEA